MPAISVRRSFSEELIALKSSARTVYKSATEVLFELQVGEAPTAEFRPESRIPNCQKYAPQRGYRLVLQRAQRGDSLIALVVGTKAHVDAFLDAHKNQWFDPKTCAPLQLAEGSYAAPSGKRATMHRDGREGYGPALPPGAKEEVPAKRGFFDALDDVTLASVGVSAASIPHLRAEYDGPDAPELLSALQHVEQHDPRLGDLLLSHAILPSNETLNAILALKDRVVPQLLPDVAVSESDLASTDASTPTIAPKVVRKKTASGVRRVEKSVSRSRKSVRPKKKLSTKSKAVAKKRTKTKTVFRSRVVQSASLPQRLSMASLKRYLTANDFRPVDNRNVGGGVWVLAAERTFAPVAKQLASRGVKCKFFPQGTRQREARPSWLIDAFKRLS
jgi:hypothetical protein